MNLKLILLLAILAGGAYYWYSQNPGALGGAGNAMGSDVSRAEGKAKSLR